MCRPFQESCRFATVLALFAVSSSAESAVLLGNLAELQTGNEVLVGDAVIGGDRSIWSYGFTTGNEFYGVDEIILSLRDVLAVDGNPMVTLNVDAGGEPGLVLGSFSTLSLPLGPVMTNVVFNSASMVVLSPNSSYWLNVGQSPGAGNFSWGVTTPSADPVGTFSFVSLLTSPDDGANWGGDAARPAFSLNGEVVPEPRSIATLAVAGIFGLLPRRRRQTQ